MNVMQQLMPTLRSGRIGIPVLILSILAMIILPLPPQLLDILFTLGIAIFGVYIAGGWLLPGRKRVVPYSIQTLKRLKPALFRQDLIHLFDLLREGKIKPLIAQKFPLAEARRAQELLGKGVIGKIVLVCSA